jgi:hypothetical protein
VLKREHHRGNAFDHEKYDENQCTREDAAQWPQQEHDTGRNSKDRRDERPSETRRSAHPEGGDSAGDSADEKEPANQNLDCQRCDRRNSDGGQTEDDKNDPLDQKEYPMLVQRCRRRVPDFARCRACSSTWQRPPWMRRPSCQYH